VRRPRITASQLCLLLVGGIAGVVFTGVYKTHSTVHAQEVFSGISNCITVVPKSWGEFKGGSAYGLAFQDQDGNVRFVLHPACGSANSPAAPIDLEIRRR
jgi:hypothetical protein